MYAILFFFFFNDTATTEIYTLSLHDALPIYEPGVYIAGSHGIRIENELVVKAYLETEHGKFLQFETLTFVPIDLDAILDRKSTRLNSSHANISYAVFCLKKKTKNTLI